jgi:hypothetical protein
LDLNDKHKIYSQIQEGGGLTESVVWSILYETEVQQSVILWEIIPVAIMSNTLVETQKVIAYAPVVLIIERN